MSYKVNFRDKSAAYISTDEGNTLKEMLLNGTAPTNIEINGNLHRSNEIVSVVQGVDLGEMDADRSRELSAGKRCRGQYSLQWEITKILKKKYGRQWHMHMGDSEQREEIRQELLKTDRKFCDYKTKSCYCEASYMTPGSRTHEAFNVGGMFPNPATRGRKVY